MSLGTPAAVLLAISFLIPGFVWTKMIRLCSPYASTKKIETLECFAFSCFNYVFAFPIICLLILNWPADLDLAKPQTIGGHLVYLCFWLSLVFVPPVVLPVLLRYVSAKLARVEKVRAFLERIGISLLHPAPTAWDYAFARSEGYWARVQLADGTTIEGLFDSNSLASGEKDDRDVFLETVFEWDDQSNEYRQLERNAGMWVGADQIRTITFFETSPISQVDPEAALNGEDGSDTISDEEEQSPPLEGMDDGK